MLTKYREDIVQLTYNLNLEGFFMSFHNKIKMTQKRDTIHSNLRQSNQISLSNYKAIIQMVKMYPQSLSHADAMVLQKTIGNRAVCQLMREIGLMKGVQAHQSVIQRAITVGTDPLPRTVDMPSNFKKFLITNGLYEKFLSLNDARDVVYMFEDDQHLIKYLKMLAKQGVSVNPPLIHKVTQDQLAQGHAFAQDIRFTQIYQPSSTQISTNAPGAHKIPSSMLPPAGTGQYWAQMPGLGGSGQEFVIFSHQFQPPATATVPLTFGNPNAPSLVMNQGGVNLGMHIQPTTPPFLTPVKREKTSYAGIPSESGRVRGHAYMLEQNQTSTDNPNMSFDNDRRTYTSESDATKPHGGISTWRFNQIERAKIPFTQVNVDPTKGKMSISQPDEMYFRRMNPDGTFEDMLMDNTGTVEYRDTKAARPKRVGQQQYQSTMGRNAAGVHPYKEPPVHHLGQDFIDPNAHSYPGYMSPPPTPFLSEKTLADITETMILKGFPHVGSSVNMPDGSTGIVTEVIDRDMIREKSRCKVKKIPKTQWPM